MTVRGIYSVLFFYPETYTPPTPAIAAYQNYSPNTIPYLDEDAEYRPFTVSSVISDSNSAINSFDVTFAATGAIYDFLDTAILGRYEVILFTQLLENNIDTPVLDVDLVYAVSVGNIIDAEADFSTITIRVGQYDNSVNADLPWRRIPWTILGPLSTRN